MNPEEKKRPVDGTDMDSAGLMVHRPVGQITPERLAELVAVLRIHSGAAEYNGDERLGRHYAAVADVVEATAAEHWPVSISDIGLVCSNCLDVLGMPFPRPRPWPCQSWKNLAPLCDLLLGPEKT